MDCQYFSFTPRDKILPVLKFKSIILNVFNFIRLQMEGVLPFGVFYAFKTTKTDVGGLHIQICFYKKKEFVFSF
jgi:hypothetical protein